MINRTMALALGLVMLTQWGIAQQVPSGIPPEILAYADTVLFNGKVYTADEKFSVAQAVALRDGKILAVGSTDHILQMAGPHTQKIDLKGNSVVPGFIDSHDHLGDYTMRWMFLEDRPVKYEGSTVQGHLLWSDQAQALRDIERFVKAYQPGELVQLSMEDGTAKLREWGTKRADLDRVSPDNPLILVGVDAPFAVNTAALKWAGIGDDLRGAPKPQDVIISGPALAQLNDRLRWAVPLAKLEEWHAKAIGRFNSYGLTSVTTRIRPESFTTLRELWLKGQLNIRWRVAFPGPLDVPRTGNLTDIGDDLLRITGADGGALPGDPAADDMWMFDPPLHPQPIADSQNPQDWLLRWPQTRQTMVQAWEYGWSLPNTHVKGDRAASEFLKAIEEAKKNAVVPTAFQRFTIDHNEVVRPEDIQKMKALGVTPSIMVRDLFQPYYGDKLVKTFGGDIVASRFFTMRGFLDAGVHPVVEADSSDVRPLWKIAKIITRKDDNGQVWGPNQKVTRQEALWMNTLWSAKKNGDDKKLGSLEPGKLADLVVLGGDYMTVPEDQIANLPIRMTVLGGRVVYESTN